MQFQLTIGGKTKRSTTGQHPVTIDWDKLPDASQQFVIAYGLKQYLADGMAGAETEVDAKAGVEKRKQKLIDADFTRTRGDNDKPDSVDTRALKMARATIRDAAKKLNKTVTKEQIAAAAAKLIEAKPFYRAEAKKQLDAEAKAREEAVNDDGADILADLLSEDEGEDATAEDTESE